MIDRGKVIKGLECCEKKMCIFKDTEKECPYWELCGEYEDAFEDCTTALVKDTLALLKAQEPRVMTLNEMAFYDSGLYVETHNGCPEGLTDELWSALIHLYCVSQNGESGYVSFINWNADVYDFDAKDYNVDFRCWTSKPTDEVREATPWE